MRTAFITNLQSTIFKDRIDILLSHYPEWEHELLIMASLFPFSRILLNIEILWIHIDWCLDLLLPYSSHFFVYPVHSYHSYWPLISAWILLITVSCVKISSWEITHFPWSWSDHITLNLHLKHQYLSLKPCTNSLCEHFWWQYFEKVNVTRAVFVAAITGNDCQPSGILTRLLRNNLCKNEFIKVSNPNNIYMYLNLNLNDFWAKIGDLLDM